MFRCLDNPGDIVRKSVNCSCEIYSVYPQTPSSLHLYNNNNYNLSGILIYVLIFCVADLDSHGSGIIVPDLDPAKNGRADK